MSRRPKAAAAVSEAAGELPDTAPLAPASRRASGARARKPKTAALQAKLEYRFAKPALLDLALTHVSSIAGPRNPAGSYQRDRKSVV